MLSLFVAPVLTLPVLLATEGPSGDKENDELGPPGLIELKGGTTQIGSSKKDIEDLMDEVAGAKNSLRALDAETPQNRVSVNPFFLGVSELTNEQYAVFVRANGHRPPENWGKKAIDDASREFLVAQGKENEERRKRGETTLKEMFERGEWWSQNWQEAEWSIPTGQELNPVTYVDYSDALAYCKWAGVRLPTEIEYQHACRGNTKNIFPWGDEWEDGKYAATNELRGRNIPFPAGHFEEGKSKEGIYELAGNVWEWTSSPYLAYGKFKKNEYKLDRSNKVVPEPMWDGNQRVAVGGSFQNTRIAARCTSRRPTDRVQMTNALGFRIAASTRTGADIAEAILRTEVRNSDARPSGVTYMPNAPIAMDRWDSAPASDDAPAGYGVIGGYEYFAFVPIEKLEEVDAAFRRKTLVEPQHLGFLTMSSPVQQPALPAGTYLVAFRGQGDTEAAEVEVDEGEEGDQDAGKSRKKQEDPWASVLDIAKDNLLFIDAKTGELVAHLPVDGVTFGKGDPGGGFTKMIKTRTEPDPADPKETIEIEESWLKLDVRVATRQRKRVLPIVIELMPEPSVFERTWR